MAADVKRVIALGPAEVRVEGRQVFVDGKLLPHTPSSEPCTHSEFGACSFETEQASGASYKISFEEFSADSTENSTTPVGPGEIYVLGDNRDASWDSRQHGSTARFH